MSVTIVVCDDNASVIDALRLLFKQEKWRTIGLPEPSRLVETCTRERVDCVILDMNFSRDTTAGTEGIEALTTLRRASIETPVILFTAWGTIARAVESIQLGAIDYLEKPWDNARLVGLIKTQLAESAIRAQKSAAVESHRLERSTLDSAHDFSRIIGSAPSLLTALHLCADVAPSEATVLITGAPGTGKELFAAALHQNSARRAGPLVKVHVGALPPSLFESELFGHVRGAFTDAREDRAGRFAVADGGTLFLDEIGTLGAAQQVRLLRVLQEGEFEPVGSTKTKRVDVRVVAATNLDLRAEVAAGRFREDLYYRLNVVEIHLPSLAERAEDIMVLAERFREHHALRNRRAVKGFTSGAIAALNAHQWPGNVRELENVIERAVILCKDAEIATTHLPLGAATAPAPTAAAPTDFTLEELERAVIEKVLRQHEGNISKAASALGLSRAALYRRMDKYQLA